MDDDKIINLFWERSESAIEETAKKYEYYCQKIAFNILNNCEDAQECINDTYVALWDTIPPNQPRVFKAFLGKIVRNISLNKYDHKTAKKRNNQFDVLLSEIEECIPSSANVEIQYEQGQVAIAISNFLRTISKENRIVFIRRYWYSDSISTIAMQFGIGESRVKSMLFRIRNKLKLYLEKEGIIS